MLWLITSHFLQSYSSIQLLNTSRGFTLLELVLVLVIVASVSVFALRFANSGVSATEVKSSARQVAAALRFARSEALTKRKETGFTLALDRHEFKLTGDEKIVTINSDIELKLFTAEEYVQDQNTGTIQFFPDGSSSGGRVTLLVRDFKLEVDVDWLTGRVVILE
jgi:general secretion pathway protein H